MSSPFGENISTKEVSRFARRLVRHQYYCKEGASAEPRRQAVENKAGNPARPGVAAIAAVLPYRFFDGGDAIGLQRRSNSAAATPLFPVNSAAAQHVAAT
ncbi:hypothetical protein [Massilia sp. TWR1-2-2]|uniref:hypothetical protein n=1 Tax=Massilia sp. TWR1-2-2 TaxID=2804584 RepID=UPI003CF322B8